MGDTKFSHSKFIIPLCVCILILAAGAAFIVNTTRILIDPLPAAPSALPAPSTLKKMELPERGETDSLYGLFGKKHLSPVSISSVQEEAKISIALHGILHGNEESLNSVILYDEKNPNSPMSIYKVGDKIAQNTYIEKILTKKIIIKSEGKLKYIPILSPEDIIPARSPDETPDQNKDFDLPKSEPDTKTSIAFKSIGLKKADGDFYIAEDGSQLARHFEIEEGDEIININGFPLDSVESEKSAIQSLKQKQSSILIKRNDKEIIIQSKT